MYTSVVQNHSLAIRLLASPIIFDNWPNRPHTDRNLRCVNSIVLQLNSSLSKKISSPNFLLDSERNLILSHISAFHKYTILGFILGLWDAYHNNEYNFTYKIPTANCQVLKDDLIICNAWYVPRVLEQSHPYREGL